MLKSVAVFWIYGILGGLDCLLLIWWLSKHRFPKPKPVPSEAGLTAAGTWYPWFFLLWITAAEVSIGMGYFWAGVVLHMALLILLNVQAALSDGRQHRFYLALILAPLIRLISLILPMANIPLVFRYFAVSIPLFLASFAVPRLARYRVDDINLIPGVWYRQLAIGLAGLPMGVTEYLILRPQPILPSFRVAYVAVPALVLMVSTGFLEELIFRGIIQKAAVDLVGPGSGVLIVSLLFAVMHITNQSWLDVGYVFCAGLFFSWAVLRTRSLTGVTLAHGINNIVLFLVLPFFPLSVDQVWLWLRGWVRF